jgi:hypothetical protein
MLNVLQAVSYFVQQLCEMPAGRRTALLTYWRRVCKNSHARHFNLCSHDLPLIVLLCISADDFSDETTTGPIVSVNGGRYDVDVVKRLRRAIYWDEPETIIRRCSWFYRTDADTRTVPYEEDFAMKLEV